MLETILEWDRAVFFAINHGLHHPWLDPVMWFITSLGLGQVQVGILLCWALLRSLRLASGVQTEDAAISRFPTSRRLFLSGIAVFVLSGLLIQVIKRLVSRPRPSSMPETIVAPDERIFMNSFPSGHSATAFAFACFIWLHVRGTRYRWVGWLAWGLAVLIGFSRVYRGVHYPTDVLGGAVVGIVCCLGVWQLLKRWG